MKYAMIFTLCASTAFAALPTQEQAEKELQELEHRFEGLSPVITKTENGYSISTKDGEYTASVEYKERDDSLCGPVAFDFNIIKK